MLLVELEGEQAQVEAELARLLAVLEQSAPTQIRVAQNDDERARLWKGRKGAFSAVGRLSPDFIVQDGVVPRTKLGEALARSSSSRRGTASAWRTCSTPATATCTR